MIRELERKDKEIFFSLLDEFYNSNAVLAPIPKSYYQDIFEYMFAPNTSAKTFIIESDGVVCGYGVINITFSMEAGGKTLWLEDLYIRKEFRSRGLGKEYFNYVFDTFKDIRRYRLEVEEENEKAIKLYKSLGFKFLDYKQMIIDKK